jgi:hypothetical protein
MLLGVMKLVRFKVLTAASMKIVFWDIDVGVHLDIVPCNL